MLRGSGLTAGRSTPNNSPKRYRILHQVALRKYQPEAQASEYLRLRGDSLAGASGWY